MLAAIGLTAGCAEPLPTKSVPAEAPTIQTIAPASWSILTGVAPLTVVSPNAQAVEVWLDAELIDETVAPFHLTWDTTSQPNGHHRLRIVAFNSGGEVDSTIDVVLDNPGRGVAVVAPVSELRVGAGQAAQLGVLVVGDENHAVTWSFDETSGPGLRGSVDANGLYSAPRHVPEPATIDLLATSVADPTKSARITIHLEGVSVQVEPEAATVRLGGTQQFTADVYGTDDQSITWDVIDSPERGSISADGLYTAPATLPDPPTATVRATSAADPGRSATATVTLSPPVELSVSPASAVVVVGTSRRLSASVLHTEDHRVTWSVEGGGPGSVDDAGLYTAPAVVPDPPQVTVVARSVADPARIASSVLTVVTPLDVSALESFDLLARSGYRAIMLSDQAMNLAITALAVAFHANHNVLTTTGTLRRTGYRSYAYEPPAPGATALVVLGAGPRIELTMSALEATWLEYPWQGSLSGSDFRGHLECRLRIDGVADLTIVANGADSDDFADPFDRTVVGDVVVAGVQWNVDLVHSGRYGESFHGGQSRHQIAGSVLNGGLPILLDERIEISIGSNCHAGGSSGIWLDWEFDTRLASGPDTWAMIGHIRSSIDTHCGFYDRVEQAESWVADGTLTRNDTPDGRIEYGGLVTQGAVPPPAQIVFNDRAPFHIPLPRALEAILPNVLLE
jgi:hypothetical protein